MSPDQAQQVYQAQKAAHDAREQAEEDTAEERRLAAIVARPNRFDFRGAIASDLGASALLGTILVL